MLKENFRIEKKHCNWNERKKEYVYIFEVSNIETYELCILNVGEYTYVQKKEGDIISIYNDNALLLEDKYIKGNKYYFTISNFKTNFLKEVEVGKLTFDTYKIGDNIKDINFHRDVSPLPDKE